MYGKMHSACLYGIDGVIIEVEVDLSNGLPQTSIIEHKARNFISLKMSDYTDNIACIYLA
jgi:hypothetical protein